VAGGAGGLFTHTPQQTITFFCEIFFGLKVSKDLELVSYCVVPGPTVSFEFNNFLPLFIAICKRITLYTFYSLGIKYNIHYCWFDFRWILSE